MRARNRYSVDKDGYRETSVSIEVTQVGGTEKQWTLTRIQPGNKPQIKSYKHQEFLQLLKEEPTIPSAFHMTQSMIEMCVGNDE